MHERFHNDPQGDFEPLDFHQLKDDLHLRLTGYTENPDAVVAAALMDEIDGHTIKFGACIEKTRTRLYETVLDEAGMVKSQFCNQVQSSYPAGSEDTPAVPSPKQFIKEHTLDGRMRPELREAQARTIRASKESLVTAVKEDPSHNEIDLSLTDTELEESITSEVQKRLVALREHTEVIKELMVIVDMPISRMGALALGAMNYPDAIAITSLMVPVERKERAALDNAIFGLKTAMKDLLDGESVIAKIVAEQYEAQVRNQVSCKLISQYEQLESAALADLPSSVETAYAVAAHLGPQYKPQSKPTVAKEIGPQEITKNVQANAGETKQVTVIGEIDNPFPWADGEKTEISLVKHGEKSLLFCDGMSAAASAISKQLRIQAENRDDFDRFWEFIKEIEINDVGVSHGNINKVKGCNASSYDGISILYYGTAGPNARRTYYVKVPTSRYAGVSEITKASGVDTESPLIILVAETDKVNQLKTFHEFGISRRHGSQYGGGSI